MDNLFLNVNIVYALLAIGFAIIDTTRKNATRLPKLLTNILAKDKKVKKDIKNDDKLAKKKKKKQPLAYNSVLAIIVNYYLYFL